MKFYCAFVILVSLITVNLAKETDSAVEPAITGNTINLSVASVSDASDNEYSVVPVESTLDNGKITTFYYTIVDVITVQQSEPTESAWREYPNLRKVLADPVAFEQLFEEAMNAIPGFAKHLDNTESIILEDDINGDIEDIEDIEDEES